MNMHSLAFKPDDERLQDFQADATDLVEMLDLIDEQLNNLHCEDDTAGRDRLAATIRCVAALAERNLVRIQNSRHT